MRSSALRDLARSFSIETSFIDATGRKQAATRDALVAAIESRSGVSLAEAASRVLPTPMLQPVSVLWGNDRTIDVEQPDGTIVDWDLALEDGSWRSGRIDVLGGTISFDRPVPPGYHTLHLGTEHQSLVIAAPPKAAAPRGKVWGLFLPLAAAHTRRSWGGGDLGDLLDYAGWMGRYTGDVIATLPMLAAFDEEPSPYSPVSRLFWNETYLDVTRLPEFRETEVDEGTIAHLRQKRDVDHAAVRREKRRVLELCARRFVGGLDYDRFTEHAREYAEFRARREHDDPEAALRYHLYVQYRMSQQMRLVANAVRRLGTGLYLDFPLGIDPAGYDAHRYAGLFASGVSVGAPPDAFFTKGQNWGFPPFDPNAIRANRYEYFRAAVRHHVTHAGVLRVDHVMGLHRLYWIPDGCGATDGVYVRYRAEELYAILVLESRRHGCAIVGEDLGTVPPEVPKMMRKRGVRRMYVVQYEAKPDSEMSLLDPPSDSVASINTHDMPTFAGFWTGKDVEDRLEQGLLDASSARTERETRERVRRGIVQLLVARGFLPSGPTDDPAKIVDGLLAWLASSDAEIVLLNPEDLWGELQPQNMPGMPERSWRHKFRMGLEDADADGSIRRTLTDVSGRRARDLLRDDGITE